MGLNNALQTVLQNINHFTNMNKNSKIITGAIIIAALFFYGGYSYANHMSNAGRQSKIPSEIFMRGNGTNMNNRSIANFTGGTVLSKDNQSLTVKGPDGSSKIVFYSDSTQIMKTVSGTVNDLTIGANVTIESKSNPDGSITAQSVQIRPARPATTTPVQ